LIILDDIGGYILGWCIFGGLLVDIDI